MSKKRKDITYLSLGAGVQSSALLIMSNLGLYDCPRADVAIFADTQDEPDHVYDTLERLKKWSKIPIEVVTHGKLSEDAISGQRFATMPLFVRGHDGKTAMLRRQCTREYKITPITKRVRGLLGLKPRQHAKGHVKATCLIGISLDEVVRMKPSRHSWITNVYPLVDAKLRREDCAQLVQDHLGFTPGRSACVYCPFRTDAEWRRMRDHDPTSWEEACKIDENIRSLPKVDSPTYVHRSLKPLREAPFKGEDQRTFPEFTEECEGMCGV